MTSTPSLRHRLDADLKTALKNKKTDRTAALRLILAELKKKDIDHRTAESKEGIPEPEILSMLQTMIKQRRESIKMYEQGNRPELAAKEQSEIAVIQGYLPPMLEGAALDAVIAQAISATGAVEGKDMGKVIGHLKAHHAGQIDFGALAPVVKAKLGA